MHSSSETTPDRPERCATCSEFLFGALPHHCPPRFTVWDPAAEGGEATAQPVYASYADTAAAKWAAEHGNRHVLIVLGGRTTVCVRSAAGAVTRWDVTGELTPVYSAIPRPAVTLMLALLLPLVLGGCDRHETAAAGFALAQGIGVLVALLFLAAALAKDAQRLWAPAPLRAAPEPPTCAARRARRLARAAAAGRLVLR